MSLNAATVIVAQLLQLKFFGKGRLSHSAGAGFGLMVFGFSVFAINWHTYPLSILATITFSAGEAMLFPSFEVLTDRLAPVDKKAVFFGAVELRQVGFFLGPLTGAFLLDQGGISALFLGCAAFILVAGLLLSSLFRSHANNAYRQPN